MPKYVPPSNHITVLLRLSWLDYVILPIHLLQAAHVGWAEKAKCLLAICIESVSGTLTYQFAHSSRSSFSAHCCTAMDIVWILDQGKHILGLFVKEKIINKPLHHCMQVKFLFFQTTPGLFYIRTLIWYLGMNVIKLQSNIFQVIFCLFSYDITCVLLSCKSIAAKQNLMQLLPVLINIVHNRLIDKSDHKLDGFWLSHLAVLVHSFFASHLVTQLYSSCNPAVFIL